MIRATAVRAALDRSGTGMLLLLALVLLAILTTTGFSRLVAIGQAGSSVHRSVRGDAAVLAAESAIDEMMARMQRSAADRAHPLFAKLRQEVRASETGRFDLDSVAMAPVTEKLLQSATAQGLKLDRTNASVDFQRQFEDLPYERFGQIRYRVRVNASHGALSGGIVRDLTVMQEFKTVLATVPRPFDQTVLYIADAWSLTDFSRVNRLRARYLAMVEELVRLLDEALATAPTELADRYRQLRDFIPTRAILEERIPVMPETRPLALYAIGVDQQSFPLDVLDLALDLDRTEAATEPTRTAAVDAVKRIRRADSDSAAHSSFLTAISLALEGTQAMLDRIWTFGETFHLMGPADERWSAVTAEYTRLRYDHWRRVATYVLSDGAGRSVASDLAELRTRVGAPSGVVLVERSEHPVVMDGGWPGKLVLVVRDGRVILRDANRDAASGSLLTVVALGGRVEVHGKVDASIVLSQVAEGSPVASLKMAEGAELRGALVALELSPDAAAPGKVICREQIQSGITTKTSAEHASLDHYVVTFAPASAARFLERKR